MQAAHPCTGNTRYGAVWPQRRLVDDTLAPWWPWPGPCQRLWKHTESTYHFNALETTR